MTDAEVLNLPSNEFQRELVRRNALLRGLSAQNDNLALGIKTKQDEIDRLDAELESKKSELEKIDSIFEGKMADYQGHVDSVQKSLKEKEDSLGTQKESQDQRESDQHKKSLEITNSLNELQAKKDIIIESLTEILTGLTTSIHETIEDVKGI